MMKPKVNGKILLVLMLMLALCAPILMTQDTLGLSRKKVTGKEARIAYDFLKKRHYKILYLKNESIYAGENPKEKVIEVSFGVYRPGNIFSEKKETVAVLMFMDGKLYSGDVQSEYNEEPLQIYPEEK